MPTREEGHLGHWAPFARYAADNAEPQRSQGRGLTMKPNRQYDPAAGAEEAKHLSTVTLRYRERDVRQTIAKADALDSEDQGCRGDWYRSELKILQAELAVREVIAQKARDEASGAYFANERKGRGH